MQTHAQIQSSSSRYYTQVDARIVILLALGLLLFLGTAIYLFTQPGQLVGGIVVLLIAAGIYAGVLSITVPVYYEITPSNLLMRSGVVRREIPLSAIQRAQLAQTSPHFVWSSKQVRIDYRKDNLHYLSSLFISPKDRTGFIRDLAAHAGNIEIRN